MHAYINIKYIIKLNGKLAIFQLISYAICLNKKYIYREASGLITIIIKMKKKKNPENVKKNS